MKYRVTDIDTDKTIVVFASTPLDALRKFVARTGSTGTVMVKKA